MQANLQLNTQRIVSIMMLPIVSIGAHFAPFSCQKRCWVFCVFFALFSILVVLS